MQKTTTKFIYFFALGISFLTFLFLSLSHYIIALTSPPLILQMLIFFIVSIIYSVVLAIAILVIDPIVSDALLSLKKLQRIENFSSPLLLKLSADAPGTFHHSLNVSNLAQAAARSIGANSLLVRTSAYYHDIGKLANPTAYIENQSGQEIPRDYDAELIKKSTKEIINHARIGVEIAEKNGLPEEITDLIAQHHGTTKVLYFYEKAREQGLKIRQTDFRYPGPLPLSREAGILMLADSIEATTRAYPNLDKEKITEIINTTINDRIADNQLKNSNLNENDLAKIKNSFESTLVSIYHQRIAYKSHDKN